MTVVGEGVIDNEVDGVGEGVTCGVEVKMVVGAVVGVTTAVGTRVGSPVATPKTCSPLLAMVKFRCTVIFPPLSSFEVTVAIYVPAPIGVSGNTLHFPLLSTFVLNANCGFELINTNTSFPGIPPPFIRGRDAGMMPFSIG